ncbi:MAG: Imm1 family immunity protein [Umezawaea sp.]
MEAIKVQYRRKSGDPVTIVRTHDELIELMDEVSETSSTQQVPSMVEISRVEDPWDYQIVTAGLGADRGFAQVSGNPVFRTTIGDRTAAGDVVYDYMANATDIPAREEVPVSTVRTILAAYLESGGQIPDDFAELHPAD